MARKTVKKVVDVEMELVSMGEGSNGVVHYRFKGTDKGIKFKDGKAPWTYQLLQSDISTKNASLIIDAYNLAGLRQHDYAGGFKDAISVLKVQLIAK